MVSRLVCLAVYDMPSSQRDIVLLLLYTMWVVKPENELTLYQQHLVLVHFLELLLLGEECVYQPQQRVCSGAGSIFSQVSVYLQEIEGDVFSLERFQLLFFQVLASRKCAIIALICPVCNKVLQTIHLIALVTLCTACSGVLEKTLSKAERTLVCNVAVAVFMLRHHETVRGYLSETSLTWRTYARKQDLMQQTPSR